MRKPALSGHPPEQANTRAGQQQAKTAGHATLSIQQPNAAHRQTSQSCPGTHEARFDCNTLSAIANLRQADAAERFNTLAGIEIGIGFATAIAAILAANWARKAAAAAKETVAAFVEVERADIVITLQDFEVVPQGQRYDTNTSKVWADHNTLDFRVMANNLGRSSALITHVSSGWFETADFEGPAIMTGPPKKYVVGAGKSTVLGLMGTKDLETLKSERFLFINVSYRSPLRKGERLIRTCFEVFGVNSNVPYREHKHEDWDKEELQRTAPPLPGVE